MIHALFSDACIHTSILEIKNKAIENISYFIFQFKNLKRNFYIYHSCQIRFSLGLDFVDPWMGFFYSDTLYKFVLYLKIYIFFVFILESYFIKLLLRRKYDCITNNFPY